MTEINDPAVARRRRKAIIQSQRSDSAGSTASSESPVASPPTTAAGSAAPQEDKTNKRKAPAVKNNQEDEVEQKTKVPKQRGSASTEGGKKKTQIRYDPDVPMSKEQLAAWRREARRVRNRESAAASRQRIRNRITELEDEVADWKSKYAQAMERLQTLENASKSGSEENQA